MATGGTYSHVYWHPAYGDGRYSYAGAAALEGQAALYTAIDHPRFPHSGLDADYKTKAGQEGLYYSPDTTDLHLVALDEANKATMTTGELAGASATPPYRINVPVLLLVGGNDALFYVGVTQYSCSELGA
jgi:hypothetical protein